MKNLVLEERRGDEAWITINREDKRNALSIPTIEAIEHAFARAADSDVRVIVLTGAGSKAFCAGGDLSGDRSIFSSGGAQTTLPLANLMRNVRKIEQPIIARVNGACMAGGMALLAMCDLAVSSNEAKFGLPEAKIGMFPMQVLALLKDILSKRDLYLLALCANPISAACARDIGLVNIVSEKDKLDEDVSLIIESLRAAAPTALRRGKYALRSMEAMSFEQAISFAEGQVGLQAMTEDVREGISSFQGKRKPIWPGR